jgi:hypothetical protein
MSGALGFMMSSEADNPIVLTGVSSVETSQHGGSIAIHSPSGGRAGDLMVAFLARDNDGTWTMPSGWATKLNGQIGIATKTYTGTSTFTFSVPDSVGIPAIRGVIATFSHCVFDVAGAIGTASGGGECTAPSINLADIGLLLACFTNSRDLTTFTTPSDMLSIVANFEADAPSIAAFSQQLSAGTTGTRTSTPSGGGDTAGVLIALKGVS